MIEIRVVTLRYIVSLGSEQLGGGVFEMQITPKFITPNKFRENPWKTKKTSETSQKPKKIPQKPKTPPPNKQKKKQKNPKIGEKICFSAFGSQNLGGVKKLLKWVVPVLVNRGGSVIAS